jgi:hypothetical protein
MMTALRIDLTAASHDRATMHYRGEVIGESREPLFAAARYLLAKGLASPEDRIETWRGKTMCLAGPVGAAAKLTVAGDRFQRYRGERDNEAAAQPPVCDIFRVGHRRADQTNANVRGSAATFDRSAFRKNDDRRRRRSPAVR